MPETQSLPTQVTSPKSVLPLKLHVSWNEGFELGLGYDYIEQAVGIPSVPATDLLQSKVADSKLDYLYVTNQDDLNQLITGSAEASGDFQGVEVKASLEFTKSVRFSETSETLVYSWYSDCTHFDRIKTPALDAVALALSKSNPEDFRLRYGDYFVSGGLQRAEFHAVYQLSSLKKDDLISFKASAAASSPDVFSVKGSAAFTSAAASSHVSISATVYNTASASAPSLGKSALTPAQVLDMFTKFQADHQDSWAVAELTHYSALAPDLSRVVPIPRSFFVDRALLLAARISYQGLLQAGLLPRDAAATLKPRATALDAKVEAEGSLYWDDPDALAADRAEAEELAKDVRAATEFLHRVHILGGGDGGYSNVTGRRGGEAGIGTHGDQTSVPADIKVSVDTFDLKGDYEFAAAITRHADKRYPGCTIIYIGAHNNWPADTGGTLNGFSGGIGQDAVHVGCTADGSRGLSWSITIKYIESE